MIAGHCSRRFQNPAGQPAGFVLFVLLSCYLHKKRRRPTGRRPTRKEWLQRYPQRCEGLAALWPSFKSDLYVLSLHADHCFQHGVHSGDGFRVGLKAALRGNHLHKFA